MNIQVDPTSSNHASAMLNSKIRPRAVVGYGVKIFHPSPPNYVTRSPGRQNQKFSMDRYSCKKLIGVLVLNFKAMFSARIKVRKKDFCLVLAKKQHKSRYRAPLNPFTTVGAHRALIDFTTSNA